MTVILCATKHLQLDGDLPSFRRDYIHISMRIFLVISSIWAKKEYQFALIFSPEDALFIYLSHSGLLNEYIPPIG